MLTGTSKEPSSAIATATTPVLVSSSHAAPRTETVAASRSFASIRATLETWRSMAWPGPIYEGNGEIQAIIDERADGKQRDALVTILYGGETSEGATHWWVYRMMSSTVHPPLFKHIEFDVNIERRKARIVIPDVLESTARPIRSPATGGVSIASASTSRMGSSSTSRRSAVVPPRR